MFQSVHYTLIFHPIKYVSGGNTQRLKTPFRFTAAYARTFILTIQSAFARRNIGPRRRPALRIRVYTRADGVKKYEESSFSPCKNRPKPDLDFKSGSLNHEVVNKPNSKCESGFSKANKKSGPSFDHDVGNLPTLSKRILSKCYCFAPIAFYCQVMDCELIETNYLKFPLTHVRRCSPSLTRWIRPRRWFHGFTNSDSVSENMI